MRRVQAADLSHAEEVSLKRLAAILSTKSSSVPCDRVDLQFIRIITITNMICMVGWCR